jgi:lysophospholipase L1-like esterase
MERFKRGEGVDLARIKYAVFWLITAMLIVMPVVLAEVYLRSQGFGDPILFYSNASYRFAPQPNQKQSRRRGASVTIDSKSLRSTRDWSDHADAKILFIGDSVTWGGTYIDDKDTFAEGVCQRIGKASGKDVVCGNAGTNQYGTDNMAARIRYRDFDDETALVVTMISPDTVRGLAEAEGKFFFMQPPPPPFRALGEAVTYLSWKLYQTLRPASYRGDDDRRVAMRSLDNLYAAIRETGRPGRKVLLVLSPFEDELDGREGWLTREVRASLAQSGFEVLDLHGAVSREPREGFYYDEVHLETRGHHFYAERIAERLMAMMGDRLRAKQPTQTQ